MPICSPFPPTPLSECDRLTLILEREREIYSKSNEIRRRNKEQSVISLARKVNFHENNHLCSVNCTPKLIPFIYCVSLPTTNETKRKKGGSGNGRQKKKCRAKVYVFIVTSYKSVAICKACSVIASCDTVKHHQTENPIQIYFFEADCRVVVEESEGI